MLPTQDNQLRQADRLYELLWEKTPYYARRETIRHLASEGYTIKEIRKAYPTLTPPCIKRIINSKR